MCAEKGSRSSVLVQGGQTEAVSRGYLIEDMPDDTLEKREK